MDSRNANQPDSEQLRSIDTTLLDADHVKTIDDFKEWMRGRVRSVFPHEAYICGLGHQHSAGVGLDLPVQVDCPLAYLQTIRNRAGGWETPIMRRWLQTRQPLLFEAENPWDDAPAPWLAQFREYGLRNAVAQGIFDDVSCTASFHCFYRIPGRLNASHGEAVRQLVPLLHEVLCRVSAHLRNDDVFASRLASLSVRETEIVGWVRVGKSNDEIASICGLSENTVKHHLTRIFRKLQVDSRAGLLYRLSEHQARVATPSSMRIY